MPETLTKTADKAVETVLPKKRGGMGLFRKAAVGVAVMGLGIAIAGNRKKLQKVVERNLKTVNGKIKKAVKQAKNGKK